MIPRQPARRLMQPGSQTLRAANRAGLAGQHEKSGLGHVLGRPEVAQDAAAGAKDHRPVMIDKSGEGVRIALEEAGQQFNVGTLSRLGDQGAEVLQEPLGRC